MDILQKLDSIIEEVNKIKKLIDSNEPIEDLKWYHTKDELVIKLNYLGRSELLIKSNDNNWEDAKKYKPKRPIFVEFDNEFFSLTLEDMITLRDYLTHKIEYLQGDIND